MKKISFSILIFDYSENWIIFCFPNCIFETEIKRKAIHRNYANKIKSLIRRKRVWICFAHQFYANHENICNIFCRWDIIDTRDL